MSADLSALEPETRELAETLLARVREELGYELRVVSTRRDCAEQARLYAQGRTAPGNVVTNARGCMSWHVMGRAFDVAFVRPNPGVAEWNAVGAIGESLGLVWGKNFPGLNDVPHFQNSRGLRIEDFCVDPDDCEGGVARSMGLSPSGLATSTGKLALAVGALVVGGVATLLLLGDL